MMIFVPLILLCVHFGSLLVYKCVCMYICVYEFVYLTLAGFRSANTAFLEEL